MVNRRNRNYDSAGFLLICLFLLTLAAKRYDPFLSAWSGGKTNTENRYIRIEGDIPYKGTYVSGPSVKYRALIPGSRGSSRDESNCSPCGSTKEAYFPIEKPGNRNRWAVSHRDIPAYQKLTLGIPLSINQESEEGLTAIPGIGPQTAKLLVRERLKRGGFKSIEELKSIKGIGSRKFQRIKPFVTL